MGNIVGHLRGIAVHRGIHHHDTVLGFIAAPPLVEFDSLARIAAPHQTVQRADRPDIFTGEFRERFLHHIAVLADDIRVIAAHLRLKMLRENHLIVEYAAVERAETAESIAGKQDSIGLVVGHHRFGPVHPRSENKLQPMMSQVERIAILHLDQVRQLAEIPTQHLESFDITDNLHIGIALQQILYFAAVIELHVVNNQVIERPVSQHRSDPVEITAVTARLHRIHQRALLVTNQKRVIRDSAG